MTLPDKLDRLSATVAADLMINGVQCEVACYGSKNDFVCRVTPHNLKPVAAEWTDGYHPPNDAGLLWIRSIDNQCLITGVVQKYLFPSCEKLHAALDNIQQMLTVDQAQSKVNVSILGSNSIQSLEFKALNSMANKLT